MVDKRIGIAGLIHLLAQAAEKRQGFLVMGVSVQVKAYLPGGKIQGLRLRQAGIARLHAAHGLIQAGEERAADQRLVGVVDMVQRVFLRIDHAGGTLVATGLMAVVLTVVRAIVRAIVLAGVPGCILTGACLCLGAAAGALGTAANIAAGGTVCLMAGDMGSMAMIAAMAEGVLVNVGAKLIVTHGQNILPLAYCRANLQFHLMPKAAEGAQFIKAVLQALTRRA